MTTINEFFTDDLVRDVLEAVAKNPELLKKAALNRHGFKYPYTAPKRVGEWTGDYPLYQLRGAEFVNVIDSDGVDVEKKCRSLLKSNTQRPRFFISPGGNTYYITPFISTAETRTIVPKEWSSRLVMTPDDRFVWSTTNFPVCIDLDEKWVSVTFSEVQRAMELEQETKPKEPAELGPLSDELKDEWATAPNLMADKKRDFGKLSDEQRVFWECEAATFHAKGLDDSIIDAISLGTGVIHVHSTGVTHVDPYNFFVTKTPLGEQTMNPNKPYEVIAYVYGKELEKMDENELISTLNRIKCEQEKLQELDAKDSKRIQKKLKELGDAKVYVTEALDALDD